MFANVRIADLGDYNLCRCICRANDQRQQPEYNHQLAFHPSGLEAHLLEEVGSKTIFCGYLRSPANDGRRPNDPPTTGIRDGNPSSNVLC